MIRGTSNGPKNCGIYIFGMFCVDVPGEYCAESEKAYRLFMPNCPSLLIEISRPIFVILFLFDISTVKFYYV